MKRFMALCLALLLLTWCAPGFAEAAIPRYVLPIRSITLKPSPAGNMYVGRTQRIQARVSPASRAHEAVSWSSNDEAIATVEGGVVTAHAPGIVQITATAGSGADQAANTITIKCKAAPVAALKLSSASIALSRGDTFSLSVAKYAPSYAYDKSVTWKSSNPFVATVDPATGEVTAAGLGVASVRATASSGKYSSCVVRVTDSVRARKVTLSATKLALSRTGDSAVLKATVSPQTAIAPDHEITWLTSDPSVATVSSEGVVTAVPIPAGSSTSKSAVITATSGNGRTATCVVNVRFVDVKSIALNQSKLTLDLGESAALTATWKPANATIASQSNLSWFSSNPSVATVPPDGKQIQAVGPGTAKIHAAVFSYKEKRVISAICTVTVRSGEEARVTITAGGDVTIGGDPRRPASSTASQRYYENLYQPDSGLLNSLRTVFSGENEITMINLESNLTTSKQFNEKTYIFRGRPAYAQILSDAGVEVVGHANNHSADFGAGGAADTRRAILAGNMAYVAGSVVRVQNAGGVRVGFCAFNALGGSIASAMSTTVRALKKKCDITVVSIHWGEDFSYAATSAQRSLGRAAIAAGADLVVGHHPHVVGGIEKYRGKYIVYSMGTLSSAILTPKDMDAFLFKQTFSVDLVTRVVNEDSVELIPVSMSRDENANDAHAYVMSGAARNRVLNKIKYYSRSFSETVPQASFK